MKLALLAFVILTLPCAAFAQGNKPMYPEITEARAHQHVKRGKFRQYIYGLPGPNDFTIAKILRKKYKIDTVLTGCEVTEDFKKRVKIYNKISDLEIKRKFKKSYQELFSEEEKQLISKKKAKKHGS
jgi:hypothetical protein